MYSWSSNVSSNGLPHEMESDHLSHQLYAFVCLSCIFSNVYSNFLFGDGDDDTGGGGDGNGDDASVKLFILRGGKQEPLCLVMG